MWFSGSVNEAVATTKQKSVVLVVFVSGNDEASASALSWLENEEVQKCLRENSTVNLKLESKSETAAQFAQIYPLLCVPVLYFISPNGVVLEAIADFHLTMEEFFTRVKKVFQQKEMKKSEDSKIDEPKNEPRAKIRMPKEKKDQEALSRIRQQIAADRLEKSEKYHREQDDKLLRKRKATTEQKVIPAKTKEYTHTRIQFRLPDGSVLVENFPINDPLRSAHSFVAENFHALSSFILMKIFPRHEYTPEELDKSFSSLDLVPSAVLLVLPPSTFSDSSVVSRIGVWQIVTNFLISPIWKIWTTISSWLFPRAPIVTSNANSSGSTSSETQSRTFGRITDLRNDSDDAEGTWNGNSTQQL